jgi:hypothetical protein
MTDYKEECVCVCVKFFFKQGKTLVETYDMLKFGFRVETTFEWFLKPKS